MFWGFFLILLGGMILLDRWDIYYGGLGSKLLIAGLIAWGASLIFDHQRRRVSADSDAVGKAEIESTNVDSTT